MKSNDPDGRVNPRPRVLILGQTPPPYSGQALMIEQLLERGIGGIDLFHVRLEFSASMSAIGRPAIGKVVHLVSVVSRALYQRFRHDITILYYCPGGANWPPFLRDVVLLLVLRRFFRLTIFHFHAAGASEHVSRLPRPLRWIAMAAYGRPDAAIQTSSRNPPDGMYFGARNVAIVPNGVEDATALVPPRPSREDSAVHVLFVGLLSRSKGVLDLLAATRLLVVDGLDVELSLIGQFGSAEFEGQVRALCAEEPLRSRVRILGERTGAQKWERFASADILCFPTYFEAESFGNVVLEAMMYGLPVVATAWRGIPDLVTHGETGLLVPVRQPEALAAALAALIRDPGTRQAFGAAGRRRYLNGFTSDRHQQRMAEVFQSVVASA